MSKISHNIHFFQKQKNGKWSNQQMMYWVSLALIPGIFVQAVYFGFGNLIQIVWGCLIALLFETLVLKLRRRSLKPVADGSAVLTAILLGISIPGYAPWWIMLVGLFFAIVIAKHLYGGLGHNIFNPAMIGYVVLLVSFPVQMTSWPTPNLPLEFTLNFYQTVQVIFQQIDIVDFFKIDGFTQATPLDLVRQNVNQGVNFEQVVKNERVFPADFNLFSSVALGWGALNIAFMLGGLFLIFLRVIRWQLPVYFLIALFFFSTLGHLVLDNNLPTPLFHLLSGGTMLGAFFIITDPVSASTTPKGQIIYAILIAFFVWLIRTYGSYPDAVAFSVLFANLCVPFIDYMTKTKPYGH